MIVKKNLCVSVTLFVFCLAGCSADQRFRREANGDEKYLTTPALRPLIVPEGFRVPTAENLYPIYKTPKLGEIGLNVDILPPSLPLATLDGSFASYGGGIALLDVPNTAPVWEGVVAVLKDNAVPIIKQTSSEIRTGDVVTKVTPREVYHAQYQINYKKTAGRQFVSIKLLSLNMGRHDLMSNLIVKQRYTVNFFNMIMLELKKMNQ